MKFIKKIMNLFVEGFASGLGIAVLIWLFDIQIVINF